MPVATEPYNANPTVHAPSQIKARKDAVRKEARYMWSSDPAAMAVDDEGQEVDDEDVEEIDSIEIFELLKSITDPEHPLSLDELHVVSPDHITVSSRPSHSTSPSMRKDRVLVEFTPTVPHCGMATIIGLTLRVRLLRALPERMKVDIRVRPGTHQSENALNKQLNDKERVAAALENSALLEVVEKCLETADAR